MVERLYLMQAGRCKVDRSVLEPEAPRGDVLRIPVWMYLVRSRDGIFLVDTGMPDEALGRPGYFDGTEDEGLILPEMGRTDRMEGVLSRVGLTPGDVTAVISTHWHFDHAGGNRRLRSTPILVHPAEREAARAGAYPPECKDPDLDYRDAGDGDEPTPGLRLLHTPGHTPGHLSLLVTLPSGPILLAVDAVYTEANWNGAPGAARDPAASRASLERLKKLAKDTGAPVFFGHDPHQADDPAWQRLQA